MDQVLGTELALLGSVLIGYLLGALPLADQVSRRSGVDIFSAGTGLAGATNVRKSVGRTPALLVVVGDLGKGALAVTIGTFFGVEGPWLLFPAFAAVLGHWKSVFTRFRGGDGLITFGGAVVALSPLFALISLAVAMLVSLGGQRLAYSSLLSVVFGYATFVALSLAYDGDSAIAVGVGGLAGLVLAYALWGHRRRRDSSDWGDGEELWDAAEDEWDDIGDAGAATERSGIQ